MSNANPLSGVERRDFLKILSLTSIGSLVYSKELLASKLSTNDLSNIVVIYNKNATDTLKKTVNTSVVQSMVDQGITSYTNIADIGEAWKSIFPGITADKVIAIKVNTLFSAKNNGTHPQVTYAVTNGLMQMDFNGTKFPANNIIIFDFHRQNFLAYQGYTLNNSKTGVRCFPNPGFSTETYDVAGQKVKISTVITQMADYMVNIAYLKNHFLSGVSHCLKNHYGSLEGTDTYNDVAFHSGVGDPIIPAITALEPIKSKQKFCMIDALYGVLSNGPDGPASCAPNKIIMGQDVVAVDTTGKNLLVASGMTGNASTSHINTAATKYSLGTYDPAKINLIELTNTTPVGIEDMQDQTKVTELLQNYPNPFENETNIQFYLDSSEHVQFTIRDYAGREIIKLVNKTLSQGIHKLTWNGRNDAGSAVLNKILIGELKTGSYHKSIIMQKI